MRIPALFPLLLLAASSVAETPVTGWRLVEAARVGDDGAALSMPGHAMDGWIHAVVPGTVLTSMVAAGRYPEPLYGLNNLGIPESLCRQSYWYRAEFTPPKGRRTWLRFDGVNYMAEVWVDGHHVGDVRGAFARGLFDVTSWVRPGAKAAVAVRMLPPNHPGTPHEQTLAGGTGRNGGDTGADGVTIASTVGWDWIPGIRDRDMGLWQGVTAFSTGDVTIHDPQVETILPLPKTDTAVISTETTLRNESDAPRSGVLEARVAGTRLASRRPITLGPHEEKNVGIAWGLNGPKLWWPNGYGQPNLYRLKLRFVADGQASDAAETTFGVRQMAYFRGADRNMTIQVNGVPIMCRGGNWGLDEAMKRIPAARLDAQVRMHRDANCNMIRNWVGQSTEADFYDACDRYGILVWDDFWLANPADGPDPVDDALFLANAREKLLRYRNHPSIAVWCGRNEGVPPPALDAALRKMTDELDGTRFYQPDSANTNGVTGHGPYGPVPFSQYFSMVGPFHTEMGAPSIPTVESIEGMMPRADWWPIDDDWAYHDLTRGAQGGDRYLGLLAKRYGPVAGFKDFVRKGAMMTYETYRAMFEGRDAHLFAPNSGTLLWMTNPAQPSFVWQLYHHDLDPTAAMFGTKVANEPVHVQMTPEGVTQLVNTTPTPVRVYLEETDYTTSGVFSGRVGPASANQRETSRLLHETPIDVPAGTAMSLSPSLFSRNTPIVRLRLSDAAGRPLSQNVYFFGPKDHPDDLSFLDALPKVTLSGAADRTRTGMTVTLRNPSKTVALLTHLSLRDRDGKRVLPAFYSEDYVHVFPGESKTIAIEGAGTQVYVDGWNVEGVTGKNLKYDEEARPEPPLAGPPPRPALPGTIVSIDCGGVDVPGLPWHPDEAFATGGKETYQDGPVTGSDLPHHVLISERWGESEYRIPVPAGGRYRVRLVFAEMSQFAPHTRRFNVEINGKRVLDDLDVAAEAGGPNKALVKEFDAAPDPSGHLVIALRKGSADEPEIRAIQVLKAG